MDMFLAIHFDKHALPPMFGNIEDGIMINQQEWIYISKTLPQLQT